MRDRLRIKVMFLILVFVVFVSVGIYPLVASYYGATSPSWLMEKQLKLGLDLKGGIHLVLRVQTDDVLRSETEQAMERLREALRNRNIQATRISMPSLTQFRIEGISATQDAEFRETSADALNGFDRSPDAIGAYRFTMTPSVQVTLRAESVAQARRTIERRVNELGVAEPNIAEQGKNRDQLLVQLPGITAVERAKAIMRSPGVLDLKIVEAGPVATRDELLIDGEVPEGEEILPGAADTSDGGTTYYRVRKLAVVNGGDLRNARLFPDENNLPTVNFTLSSDGARKFGTATESNIGRHLAIVLDSRVVSAPRIDNRITTDGNIHGNFTRQEAQDLALVLRSGALAVPVTYLEERTIGPTLGADSIRSGVVASLIGLALIVTFMLWYYKLSGVNATIALLFNLFILLGLMAFIGAVMTLPGIAGFVLTMGIGVDSNVLVFERIKEELDAQQRTRTAINAGFSRVFLTLLDTHIAAMIAAAFLFQFGTGPIRGFAVTLSIGLVTNLFTSTFVSKTLFELALARRRDIDQLSI